MDTKSVAENWLTRFALSAFRGNVDATVQTFFPHGWLRDALVFTWNTRSLEGRDKISAYLHDTLPAAHLYNFKVDERKGFSTEPVLEGTGIGMGFTFEMPDRRGRGYAFLQEDMATADWKALSLFTMLDAIKGHEEVGPEPGVYGGHTLSWEEVDIARRKRIEEDPYVVISEYYRECSLTLPLTQRSGWRADWAAGGSAFQTNEHSNDRDREE